MSVLQGSFGGIEKISLISEVCGWRNIIPSLMGGFCGAGMSCSEEVTFVTLVVGRFGAGWRGGGWGQWEALLPIPAITNLSSQQKKFKLFVTLIQSFVETLIGFPIQILGVLPHLLLSIFGSSILHTREMSIIRRCVGFNLIIFSQLTNLRNENI